MYIFCINCKYFNDPSIKESITCIFDPDKNKIQYPSIKNKEHDCKDFIRRECVEDSTLI